MDRKSFTVDEANEVIPVLDRMFERIREIRDDIREVRRKIEVLDLLWGVSAAERSNPDYNDFVRHKRAINKSVSEIEQLIQNDIIGRGLRFPAGGLENGLVDFPTTIEGRRVYLCWRHSEPEVLYWHETDAGFQGRQEITAEQRGMMGRQSAGDMDDSGLDSDS